MNIAILCYPTFGGSGIVATELGLQLAQLNHNVHFISVQQPVRLDIFNSNIYYHEVGMYDYPLFENFVPYQSAIISKLVDVALHENIDLIHAHYAIPFAGVAYMAKQILAGKGKHVPYVTTLHGTDITLVGKDKSFINTAEFTINQSDAITAVSNSLKEDTFKNFNVQKEINVIYNFIDNKKVQEDLAHDHYNNKIKNCNDEKIITHVSNFRQVKRIQDIVYGFELINKKIKSKLLLVGDGPEKSFIEQIVCEKNLDSVVKFLGKQYNINSLFKILDLFILASKQESFGLAALEAMACGVPVVSTDIGGLPELNIDGETGAIFKLKDFTTMAQKSLQILQNPTLSNKLKSGALKQAQQFDITNIIPQYINVYNKILN